MTSLSPDTKVWCTRCGQRLHAESTAQHVTVCQPRWTYWFPRAHPYLLATIALAVGVVIGWVL